jgi:hypothetical protein
MNDSTTDAGRWASEGGAAPDGPATHRAAGRVAGTPAMPESPGEAGDPRPDRQHQSEPGDQPAPHEIGESG